MKKSILSIVFAASLLAGSAFAQNVSVGGQSMLPSKNIVQNAVNSADHTTLVAAIKAADLVDVLQTDGPFTVFAPTNSAFAKLPAGTVESLVKPENKSILTNILTYHVIPGRYDFDALSTAIERGNGKAVFKTVSGGTLTFMYNGLHNIAILDEKGREAAISVYDVYQSNGVINVVDTVLMPN